MTRVVLIHWKAAEAPERVARLRAAGYEAEAFTETHLEGLRVARESPPAAFVIDLSRLPSHGREVAGWLRQTKATREVPLVFVGGASDKVGRVRQIFPDAVYSEWERIGPDLRSALRSPPVRPVVPPGIAGYSGTPLPKKLGIGEGSAVLLMGAPAGFEATLGDLPEGARALRRSRAPLPLVLLFARSQADLERRFPQADGALAQGGALWILWPKKASGIASDLSEPAVRAFGLARSFVDYKICAVDETWSGLRFARRKGSPL